MFVLNHTTALVEVRRATCSLSYIGAMMPWSNEVLCPLNAHSEGLVTSYMRFLCRVGGRQQQIYSDSSASSVGRSTVLLVQSHDRL